MSGVSPHQTVSTPPPGWGNIFSAQGLAQKLAQWVLVRCWSGEQALTPWPRVHFLICTFPA